MANCLLEKRQNGDCKECRLMMSIKMKKKPKRKRTPLGIFMMERG